MQDLEPWQVEQAIKCYKVCVLALIILNVNSKILPITPYYKYNQVMR